MSLVTSGAGSLEIKPADEKNIVVESVKPNLEPLPKASSISLSASPKRNSAATNPFAFLPAVPAIPKTEYSGEHKKSAKEYTF